jgi:hypothetical protein
VQASEHDGTQDTTPVFDAQVLPVPHDTVDVDQS